MQKKKKKVKENFQFQYVLFNCITGASRETFTKNWVRKKGWLTIEDYGAEKNGDFWKTDLVFLKCFQRIKFKNIKKERRKKRLN